MKTLIAILCIAASLSLAHGQIYSQTNAITGAVTNWFVTQNSDGPFTNAMVVTSTNNPIKPCGIVSDAVAIGVACSIYTFSVVYTYSCTLKGPASSTYYDIHLQENDYSSIYAEGKWFDINVLYGVRLDISQVTFYHGYNKYDPTAHRWFRFQLSKST